MDIEAKIRKLEQQAEELLRLAQALRTLAGLGLDVTALLAAASKTGQEVSSAAVAAPL